MTSEKTDLNCGIVMPISSMDGCSEGHWGDVLRILNESIANAGFAGNLVSNADDVGIIHKRIIQNLYDNPIVVCDVSGKNPNVMFELGLRLAFDKPTIIVKDDKTSYSFDTSSIEHLEYPRDLRFSKIVEFKKLLSEKLKATYEKANSDPSYTTFLKHFGEFKVAKLDKKEVSGDEYIIEELQSLRRSINRMSGSSGSSSSGGRRNNFYRTSTEIDICLSGVSSGKIEEVKKFLARHPSVGTIASSKFAEDHLHFMANASSPMERIDIEHCVEEILGRKIHKSHCPSWRPNKDDI